jgi:hypothetical protein
MIQAGDILRDDEQRSVKVLRLVENGHKVELERMDRRPREHRTVIRWKAEVDHYPEVHP